MHPIVNRHQCHVLQYSSSGIYIGTNFIKSDYIGDWIIFKLPIQIILNRFRFYTRATLQNRSPGEWKCYGSNDGINFIEIIEASQTTKITTADYISGLFYEKILDTTFLTPYLYIGFTFNKLAGNDTILNFIEIQIFGKELLNPIFNYTTSNVAKNLIIYDTPNVSKKFGFLCTVNNTIYSNNGNTPYYSYDIFLPQYTTTKYLEYTNDPYRAFKITLFIATCYFGVITNGIPDVLSYEIFMSNKTNSSGGLIDGQSGLNICAIGFPENLKLDKIMPNNLFLMKNSFNNFNYLSIVCITPVDVRVVITDILG